MLPKTILELESAIITGQGIYGQAFYQEEEIKSGLYELEKQTVSVVCLKLMQQNKSFNEKQLDRKQIENSPNTFMFYYRNRPLGIINRTFIISEKLIKFKVTFSPIIGEHNYKKALINP